MENPHSLTSFGLSNSLIQTQILTPSASLLEGRANTDEETVSKMNNTAKMLFVRENNSKAKKYEQIQKLRRTCHQNMNHKTARTVIIKYWFLFHHCAPWPSLFPLISLHVAMPQFRSGFARDAAYNTAAQPAL